MSVAPHSSSMESLILWFQRSIRWDSLSDVELASCLWLRQRWNTTPTSSEMPPSWQCLICFKDSLIQEWNHERRGRYHSQTVKQFYNVKQWSKQWTLETWNVRSDSKWIWTEWESPVTANLPRSQPFTFSASLATILLRHPDYQHSSLKIRPRERGSRRRETWDSRHFLFVNLFLFSFSAFQRGN